MRSWNDVQYHLKLTLICHKKYASALRLFPGVQAVVDPVLEICHSTSLFDIYSDSSTKFLDFQAIFLKTKTSINLKYLRRIILLSHQAPRVHLMVLGTYFYKIQRKLSLSCVP